MKLNVNYTIEDMFKHNQLITAEKTSPRYLDFIKVIDKMARLKPCDYTLFIELKNDKKPIEYDGMELVYITAYYSSMDDIAKRMLTVEYHGSCYSVIVNKEPARQLKAWIGDYMKDNGL